MLRQDLLDSASASSQTQRALAPALLLSLLLLDPAGVSPILEWSESGVCPGAQEDLELAIASYLRAESSERALVEASLRSIDAGPVGLRLELEIWSQAGTEEHTLTATSCERLVDHAALLIAGAIDPFLYVWPGPDPASEAAAQRHPQPVSVQRPLSRASVASQPPELPPQPPESPLQPVREAIEFGPLELAEPTRERAPISGALGIGATTFIGLFPQVGGGVELEGALERGRLRWQSGLSGWFGGRFRARDADVGGDLWALGLGSGLCGVPGARRVRVPLCASAGAGFISVRAIGTVEPMRSTQPWAWAGGDARVLFLFREDLAIGLGVGVHAALVRPAWEVRSPGVRFTVPPVMGVLRLTFEARELRRRNSSRRVRG